MLESKRKKLLVRQLRRRATLAEKRLCKLLGQHRIKYVFQKSFSVRNQRKFPKSMNVSSKEPVYIVDFWLPEHSTIIEIDGGIHNNRYEQDCMRTFELLRFTNKAVKILLRFSNEDVLRQGNKVIQTILSLEKVRFVPKKGVNIDEKRKRLSINQSIAESNEIRSIVNRDPDLSAWQKRQLLKESAF